MFGGPFRNFTSNSEHTKINIHIFFAVHAKLYARIFVFYEKLVNNKMEN